MPNEVSNCEEKLDVGEYDFEESYYTFEEQKCLQMVFETFHEILLQYNDILLQITQDAYYCPTSYSLHKIKFKEIRKHLFDFLYMHKDFIKLNAIVFKPNESNIRKKVRFCYLDDASKLIDLNSYLKVLRKMKKLFGYKSIEDLKHKYTITLKVIYKRKNTLQALKNFFKEDALSEESMVKLLGDYFIEKKSFKQTYKMTSYKSLLEHLKGQYSENCRTMKTVYSIINVSNAYTWFLCQITDVDINSNDYLLYVRKFDEVLKEFYEFAVAHKKIIKLNDVYIKYSSKSKLEFAKVDFNYSKNGLNFLSLNSLKELKDKIYLWNETFCKQVSIDCSFNFNYQNLKKIISLSINKNVNSVEGYKNLCYDTFLGNTKSQNNQKCSSYEDLYKTLSKRHDAFFEGKVSRTYFNQLCCTSEGSTDENGERFKCNICLGELEIGAEVCRLPCGHFNCKTCIEEWFDIRTENSDEYETSDEDDSDTSVEHDTDTLVKDNINISVEENNATSLEDDNDTSVEYDTDTLVKDNIDISVEENNATSLEDDNDTSVKEDNETLDDNDTASENIFKEISDEIQVNTADKYERNNSNKNSSDDSKASDRNPDEALIPDSEASKLEENKSTLEKDMSSCSVSSPVAVGNETPSSDVYWNEYVVDDNEEQKARNQCPICKHICS